MPRFTIRRLLVVTLYVALACVFCKATGFPEFSEVAYFLENGHGSSNATFAGVVTLFLTTCAVLVGGFCSVTGFIAVLVGLWKWSAED